MSSRADSADKSARETRCRSVGPMGVRCELVSKHPRTVEHFAEVLHGSDSRAVLRWSRDGFSFEPVAASVSSSQEGTE